MLIIVVAYVAISSVLVALGLRVMPLAICVLGALAGAERAFRWLNSAENGAERAVAGITFPLLFFPAILIAALLVLGK